MSTEDDPNQESPKSDTDAEQGAAKPMAGSNGQDAESVERAPGPRRRLAERPERERPPDKQDHDVLVFARRGVLGPGEYIRHPVTKQLRKEGGAIKARPGEFHHMPERLNLSDPGVRRAVSVARVHDGSDHGEPDTDKIRGPAFAAIPIKEEPIGSYVTCHLINVEHLQNPNYWTVEEWNDGPLGMDYPTPKHPENVEFLVALPWGKVFRFKVWDREQWSPGTSFAISAADGQATLEDTTPSPYAEAPSTESKAKQQRSPSPMMDLECVDLKIEPEIWSQLRNGCIAGRVRYSRGDRTVPLVNVTALQPLPKSPEEEAPRAPETAAE